MLGITKIKPEEGAEAAGFIVSLAEQFIFADYTEEGRAAFREYVTASSLVGDDAENFAIIARLQGSLVGIAKMKRKNHLSMLFIAAHCQGNGYGRRLLEAAVAECQARNPGVSSITANSSRFAFPFFLKQGFQAVAKEEDVHGIRFTPVRRELAGPGPLLPTAGAGRRG